MATGTFRNALLTGNPLYPLEVRVLGHMLDPGWYGPDAMRLSPYYMPFGDWRALVDTLLAVARPTACAVLGACRGGGSGVGRRTEIRRAEADGRGSGHATAMRGWAAAFGVLAILNVVLYWVFIPYRSQQRFMLQALGLAAVPLALLLDRRRWLCLAARRFFWVCIF